MSARERLTNPAPTTGTNDGASGRPYPGARSPGSGKERSESGAAPTQSVSSASAGQQSAPSTGSTEPCRPKEPESSASNVATPSEPGKVRCLCGKWWALRQDSALVLRCKLCKRDIVVCGRDLEVEYR